MSSDIYHNHVVHRRTPLPDLTWERHARTSGYKPVFDKTGINGYAGANLSDLMHSATGGEQFFGHGRQYYDTNGETSKLREIVSDVTSLLCGEKAEDARRLMPDTFRLVEELVYGKQP